MHPPSVRGLPEPLSRAVTSVARTLERAGHRAWLVGGAVRDLVLGLEPKDADLATPARPEEIEALFERTHAVGKAFGTVVVRVEGIDLQVTTFRAERDYRDGRRPADVRFGTSLAEDAARRDFTCNALFLDPLDDEFLDPTGGLEDLVARRLRCVGDPQERFAEDGLRLLRLARLAANYGLEVEPFTRAAAARSLGSLRGVSAERVLAELERMAAGLAPGRAVRILADIGALKRVIPGLQDLTTPDGNAALDRRCAAVESLGAACGTRRFLGALCRPLVREQLERTVEGLRALRAPRAIVESVARAWELEAELEACLAGLASGAIRRSSWLRLVRSQDFEDALAVWRAWHPLERERELAELSRRTLELPEAERFPVPWITSEDLAQAGIPRGPRWSELLREAEDLQLDGAFSSRPRALAWLAERARRPG